MTETIDTTKAKKHFLDVGHAEIVNGSDVIVGKVSDVMSDADRFGLPQVKPPLSEALIEARRAKASEEVISEQNAMSGEPAGVDEIAGSTEMLKPGGAPGPT